jgi:glycerol-3-phosphate O-acyltransferase
MLSGETERLVAPTVVARVVERTIAQVGRGGEQRPLEEVLTETLLDERDRLEHAGDARTDGDRAFYARIRHELSRTNAAALVQDVVARYADEIRGHFDRRVYAFATRVVPSGLTALLGGVTPSRLLSRHREPALADHVVIEGETATLAALVERGTVVLVPTHTSNLDSLLFGHSIYRMHLPPFCYGAGLNLFANPVLGFFMRHLGAYTIDRTKTDPLYRQTLKEYVSVLLERGQHNLFFPGGTRSRSGAVETHLKKGLLGSGVAAFRNNLRQHADRPRIFFVPATVSYPLVLEAQSLVAEFLERSGGSRYVAIADDDRIRRWLDFLGGLLHMDVRIRLVIGKPLDPFGDDVDAEGASRDPRGRPIDPSRYLLVDGTLADDDARDAEYTRMLAERIVAAYRADTVALPTTILAFAIFELLRRRRPELDVYHLLRELGCEPAVPIAAARTEVDALLAELRVLRVRGAVRLGSEARDAEAVIEEGLKTFGIYHSPSVLTRRDDQVVVGNPNLLFYYRNRLDSHALRGTRPMVSPQWGDA